MRLHFRVLCRTLCIVFALSGCVSTPNTTALITPIGAAGYHTFAPPDSPDRIRASNLKRPASAADTLEATR